MPKTLFLYLDFLGFRSLSSSPEKVRQLFKILDSCNIHKDSNYKTIVFSDTLLAYNSAAHLKEQHMWTELMYLIEGVHDITHQLTGSGITFRAIIRFGEFEHLQLEHLEGYFGEALNSSYDDESNLPATGLFLHESVLSYNHIFPSARFSEAYHYSFLAYDLARLDEKNYGYPTPRELTQWDDAHIESRILFQIQHLQDLYEGSFHPNPSIRSKYLGSWTMYYRTFPELTKALISSKFDPYALCEIDWSEAQEDLNMQKKMFS